MTCQIIINGKKVEAKEGDLLLRVLEQVGDGVPHLCYDSRLPASASCRLCLVEVEGHKSPVCSCNTPVRSGMNVKTHTPALEHYRETELKMLGRDCAKDSPLAGYMKTYGAKGRISDEAPSDLKFKDLSHPYIAVNMDRCITCFRCVHICDQLQGEFVWRVVGRGAESQIRPGASATLQESACVSCGACVDTCPTGALEDQTIAKSSSKPDHWVRTLCPYCGVGCELDAGVAGDKLIGIKPSLEGPSNKGHLCVKGRYAFGYVDAPDRITTPLVRGVQSDGTLGEWREVTWDEALTVAAESLKNAVKHHGPDSIGVLASARATNEDSFLAQKFARAVLGTNNVDCCARVCHAPTAAGMARVFGTGAATNSFNDIEKAGLFFVIGANPTENHPVVGARIKQRVLKGVPLIVADPRRTELAKLAKVHLALRPGTNIPLLQAIANVIISEKLCDESFIEARTEGFTEFKKQVSQFTPERAAQICGVSAELIRQAARLYAKTAPAMCIHGLGITENIQGTEGVMAISHLALLTGNIGKPGSGVNPLRGQNNVQGTAVMGCEPNRLVGSQKYESAKKAHEELWKAKISETRGQTLLQMIDSAGEGKLRSMIMIGYDVFFSTPHANEAEKNLRKLDSMIVMDLFMNETAREFGTVFLPAVSSYEKDGTFMNSERRIQRVRKAVSPRGQAKPDWEIMCLLAKKMGADSGFNYKSPEEVWNEVRALWPAVRGISYQRLEGPGLQWPCLDETHPGTEILHQKSFPIGDRAKFKIIDYVPSKEVPNNEFPFVLNSGRTLYHFNAATMTGRTLNSKLQADDLLQIHTEDAKKLGISQHCPVLVKSQYGEFKATAWVCDEVMPGHLFSSFHHVEAFVNRAVGGGRDPISHTPEYKTTAVSVSRL